MKQTAVEYLIKEFSNILGKIQTEPLQDLFLIDAMEKAKEMEKQQIIDAYGVKVKHSIEQGTTVYTQTFGEQYYNEQFKNK